MLANYNDEEEGDDDEDEEEGDDDDDDEEGDDDDNEEGDDDDDEEGDDDDEVGDDDDDDDDDILSYQIAWACCFTADGDEHGTVNRIIIEILHFYAYTRGSLFMYSVLQCLNHSREVIRW